MRRANQMEMGPPSIQLCKPIPAEYTCEGYLTAAEVEWCPRWCKKVQNKRHTSSENSFSRALPHRQLRRPYPHSEPFHTWYRRTSRRIPRFQCHTPEQAWVAGREYGRRSFCTNAGNRCSHPGGPLATIQRYQEANRRRIV